ncbi:hypothetical protein YASMINEVIRUS_1074 [Yasminevirus sp. GU-2018]|uniref:Uncharacterized protein n=1 Tax=Yasminevirus sp. GU-2018 TaxID=2420051 RepID=A0A5K0UAI8_9VIRU|nr:hypothetical protein YASMINEVIRUS_1074 [Yasminevirus sp. GU-2018]
MPKKLKSRDLIQVVDLTYDDKSEAPRQLTKKRKIEKLEDWEEAGPSDDRKFLQGHERKIEKDDHNELFAVCLKDFYLTHDTKGQDCVGLYLDAGGARTTLTLAKHLSKEQMKQMCANTFGRDYKQMCNTITDAGIECYMENEDIHEKVHEERGIENKGRPMCMYLDFCGMWTQKTQEVFRNALKYYCFNGSYCGVTLCLTKRKPQYPSDPNIILIDMLEIASLHGRRLEIVHSKTYGKNPEMFFIMFRVI